MNVTNSRPGFAQNINNPYQVTVLCDSVYSQGPPRSPQESFVQRMLPKDEGSGRASLCMVLVLW